MKREHWWHRDKQLARAISSELRELWNRFDPIGVSGVSGIAPEDAADEYDSYHSKALELLKNHATDDEHMEFLSWAVTEHMEMPLHEDRAKEFIGELRSWFVTVEARTLKMLDE